MGLFDLPAALFAAVDDLLGVALPGWLRLALWGVLAGWLTMILYRRLSNQQRIGELKAEQKARQREIAEFDGEFDELMPLIMQTLGAGFRQLGLALGPALLATVPILFLLAWVSGAFGYDLPEAGSRVEIRINPAAADVRWAPASKDTISPVTWPPGDDGMTLSDTSGELLRLPLERAVPVIHKKQWWNLLFANPIGYLPETSAVESIEIGLQPQQHLAVGPGWMRGWMFLFFSSFLLSSIGFKFFLRID